ncbi:iron chelate uptake ABC transporter family permease subunit [Streptomyces chumphonensis]|uniref:Iron chelate uptake ABC transporter family permease subunit n=3 Tax=Streptomyces chumphonensis TaxID=1214925 RepID=A0A927EYQ4_9ACTN|nr:iron chelate uptake ABC transporter family permease subunit [Streptomyces chumphonensis]MBD3931452.1 iron chelate uptake ABC transporter family permease subunit [Streptomyces chumphonensis]
MSGTLRTARWGRYSLRWHPRALAVVAVCTVLALAVAVVAVGSGEYPLPPADVLRTIAGQGHPADAFVVNDVRLPRVVTGLLVGAALGTAGALFQSLTRNPLGSPDVLGFTQGAATGALAVIVLAGGSSLALAGGAALGGLLTGALIYALAWRQGVHGYRLVLIGIGVMAVLTGVNGYLLTRAQITEAGRAVLWLTGSLDGRGWDSALPLLAVLVALLPLALGGGRALRLLEMGDDAAAALGVRVERLRLTLLAAAVLLTAAAAAAAGPVSFVALTAPQLARRLTRAPGANLLPSLCVGAALLVGADLLAQHAVTGRVLPVGVVTGLVGGAYLVWLLATERRAGRI